VRRHAKASPAGSIQGSGSSRGLFGRAFATRGAFSDVKGSGARSFRSFILAAVAITAMLVAAPAAGAAANNYVSVGEFANEGFAVPTRIAVDHSTGNVLVVDSGADQVKVFDSSGNLLTQLGSGVLFKPFGIAIDQTTHKVYVGDAAHNRIVRFESDGAVPPTYTLDGTFTSPAQGSSAAAGEIGNFASPLAVDPSSGDLLVADRGNLQVTRFTSAGTFVNTFDGTGSEGGPFAGTNLVDIAAGVGGDVYVIAYGYEAVGAFGPEFGGSVVQRFDSAGGFDESIDREALGPARSVAFDPSSERLFVAVAGISLRVYEGGSLVGGGPYPAAASQSDPRGLAVAAGSAPRVYGVTAQGDSGFGPVGFDSVQVLVSLEVPTISPATDLTSTTAHLSGTVDPDGATGSFYHFEYSLDGTNWSTTPDLEAPAEDASIPVAADLSDLAANSEYQARLVLTRDGGKTVSPTITFTTKESAPLAVTESAAADVNSATLRGTVNPFGLQTTYHFEFGTSTAYGSRTPVGHEVGAGNGRAPVAASQTITGLQPGTIYHYRIVAENSAGQSVGDDKAFTTSSALVSRETELVSGGEASFGIHAYGYMAAVTGNSLLFTTPAPAPDSATTAVRLSRLVTHRGPNGWSEPLQVDLPFSGREDEIVFYSTVFASDDLSRAVVASDQALTPDAYQDGTNLYLRNLVSGQLKFIGGNPDPKYLLVFNSIGNSNALYLGGAPDLSSFAFRGPPLTSEAGPGSNIYQWSVSDGLTLASVQSDGTAFTSPFYGCYVSPVDASSVPCGLGPEYRLTAADGSAVAFGLKAGVYARIGGSETRPLSVSTVAGEPTAPQQGEALSMSRDGRYVVFNVASEVPLTGDAPATEGNIYRYDLDNDELEFIGQAGFGSASLATSRDGSYIYYQSGTGIFVWHDGENRQISAASPGNMPRSLSLNGKYLTLPSRVALNSEVTGGVEQVYLYDFDADQLTCVSCPPAGVDNRGATTAGQVITDLFDNYRTHVVSETGEVFFETGTALDPGDVNGAVDVYAYRDGRQQLISPGNQNMGAYLMDASPDGANVFFYTEQSLAGAQKNGLKIYDARIGGGFTKPPLQPLCSGEDCQSATTPPQLASPTAVRGAGTHLRRKKGRCRHHAGAKEGMRRCKHGGKHQKKPRARESWRAAR
jgi:hypothetical protein